jgi:nitrite reductase (cytochrome c-552)
MKVSEHWVRSPLLEVNRSCQTCHPYSDQEIRSRVEAIQDRHHALLTRAGNAAVSMLDAIAAVRRPYDDRNREAAAAEAREALAKNSDREAAPQERRRSSRPRPRPTSRHVAEGRRRTGARGRLQRAAQWG